MDEQLQKLHEALCEPFMPEEIEWRVGSHSEKTNKVRVLAYITARAAMDRLDYVVGPARWADEYIPGVHGGLGCRIKLFLPMPDGTWQWVSKEDGAENTQVEAVKGGRSDAFKRAAVKWGIGRYLYRLPSPWVPVLDGYANGDEVDIQIKGKRGGFHIKRPTLPSWAIPRRPETAAETEVRRGQHHPEWEQGGRERFMSALAAVAKNSEAPGMNYERLKRYLVGAGKPKPSTAPPEKRDSLLRWLAENPDICRKIAA